MSTLTHLRRDGVSVVVLTDERLPRILHWGADLGELDDAALAGLHSATAATVGDSAVTFPQPVSVLPALAEGWLERPSLSGARSGGRAWSPLFAVTTREAGEHHLRVEARDEASALGLVVELTLEVGGVLAARAIVTNTGDDDYHLHTCELSLPVPAQAREQADFAGRWAQERQFQRREFQPGQWVRESRGGKPGLENQWLVMAGEPGFGHRRGQVWAAHLAWSGSQAVAAQRTPYDTRVLSAGELIAPDEVVLAPGESYYSPTLYGSHGVGTDRVAHRFHRLVRSWGHQQRATRPVTWNSWEAVYFDHDPQVLAQAVERAASIGVERVVLDDGWFGKRRDDHTSLGDWTVDRERWTEGLKPFADLVHSLGMEFGLWVEPEMISVDSDLARAHPDWFFDAGHGIGLPSRQQYVLDLGHPEAKRHILEAMSALITEIGIEAFKWDHNRYLLEGGHQPTGAAGQRNQTLAALEIMDELTRRHSDIGSGGFQIESCASGGGRADLRVMASCTRMWPSDCNDPHERVQILTGTEMLLPPEVIGTHVGASPDHITGRTMALNFRGTMALIGHYGIEAPLERVDEATLAEYGRWIALHKRFRGLLHTGEVLHLDTDPSVAVRGVVAENGSQALYSYAVLHRPTTWPPERLRLEGLDDDRTYRVEVVERPEGQALPPWADAAVELPGRVLATVGLEGASLRPDHCILVHAQEVDR
ncbi:alpha-galactosidase [Aestuariimicrobium ganziense]|uniref:alpha-galactosidase n=1 Tax=Aestuariimicrobium ganziense TaxID=2773677 RepID=UPI0019435D1D|nr:alpha-galactosidase [Aestuariimicrobium ganziense]